MTQAKKFVEKKEPRGKGPRCGTREHSGSRRPLLGPDATCCRHVVAAAMRGARSRGGSGARARGGSPPRGFTDRPQDREQEIVSSPGRAPAAAAPALLIFWNLPQVGARGRMGGEERGRGRGEAATRSAPPAPRGRRAVAALPTARHSRATSVGTTIGGARPCEALLHAPPRPSLSARACHLTWVAFSYRLRSEEERALFDERLVEAVELPVHGGVGGSSGALVKVALKREER